ncbi:putative ABC transporter permease YtrD [Clostridium acetireducens DSM 10703]|jgi:hypothetical protein|uniref:Putative ABC transporter permease YtrD n=1 Tax=Clostridium acetireducens DSM 10703 TaxID=1121290 RepID=A0A1E8EYL9_9CLOT|nr:hypothetical protein [Clostridium acetireducens]OFI06072.1 putative ABC transporter permease YtrD [Clostridium acetireducens DSM 10703]
MKNFLNKALLYKEWKDGKWAMLIFFMIQFFTITSSFLNSMDRMMWDINHNHLAENILNNNEKYYNIFWGLFGGSSIVLLIIIVITISFIIMGSDRNNNFEYLSTMPFSREEIINTKFFIGKLTIAVPTLINFAIISFSYFKNLPVVNAYIKANSLPAFFDYSIILKWFLLNFLVYIFVFALLMLMHSICGNAYAATLLGTIALVFPGGILHLIWEFIRINMGSNFSFQKYQWLQVIQSKIIKWLTLALYGQMDYNGSEIASYSNFGLKCIILVVVIIILYFATKYLFKKNNFERTGNILMFKILEPVLKYGSAICFGLFIACIAPNFIYRNYEYYLLKEIILSDICFVVFSIVFYFTTSKLIKSFRN